MRELTIEEVDAVSGRGWMADIASGLAVLGTTILAIALAPEEALVGAVLGMVWVGTIISGAAAGMFIRSGIDDLENMPTGTVTVGDLISMNDNISIDAEMPTGDFASIGSQEFNNYVDEGGYGSC